MNSNLRAEVLGFILKECERQEQWARLSCSHIAKELSWDSLAVQAVLDELVSQQFLSREGKEYALAGLIRHYISSVMDDARHMQWRDFQKPTSERELQQYLLSIITEASTRLEARDPTFLGAVPQEVVKHTVRLLVVRDTGIYRTTLDFKVALESMNTPELIEYTKIILGKAGE